MSNSFLFFNQLATNRRVARLEGAIVQQRNELDRQALNKEQLDRKRNVLFRAKREVEKIQQPSDLSLFDQALSLEMLQTYLAVNGVTPEIFTELIDKEYAARTLDTLHRMRTDTFGMLSPAERSKAIEESQRRFLLRHLDRVSALFKIRERLPRIPLCRRITGRGPVFWIVVTLLIQPLLGIPYLLWDRFDLAKTHFVSNGLYLVTGAIVLREVVSYCLRKLRKSDLQKRAAAINLQLFEGTTRDDINPHLETEHGPLKFHGLEKMPTSSRETEAILSQLQAPERSSEEGLIPAA